MNILLPFSSQAKTYHRNSPSSLLRSYAIGIARHSGNISQNLFVLLDLNPKHFSYLLVFAAGSIL